MNPARWVFIALLVGGLGMGLSGSAFSQPPKGGTPDAVLESYRQSIQAAGSGKEKARLHKELGDLFSARGDIRGAGEEYAKALSLDRGFSREDRIKMARYLSWSDRVDDAIRELDAILAEDPGNIDARIHLARCLSWKGKLRRSLEEAEKVLAISPDNRDALLVKANSLKWAGNRNAALSIYKGLLRKQDDFDTRLGLSQAYLSDGFLRGAREEAGRLKPVYPYQETEAKNLDAEIKKITRPVLDLASNYYDDSDDNRLYRYGLTAGFWAMNWKIDLGYLHTDAKDPSRDTRNDDLSVHAYTRVTERIGFGGGIGINQTGKGDSSFYLEGRVRADAKLGQGKIGAAAAREVFAETAQLIENRIRYTTLSSDFEYPLPYRFTFRANYAYKDYSDDNRSNDWGVGLAHTFDRKDPVISLGYRARYLDFRRETGSGYFDPADFLSHLGFVAISYEDSRWYAYLEPFYGHQSFKRKGTDHDDWIWGGNGTIGIRFSTTVSLEANGEGGNYAVGTAAGFNYYLAGLRLRVAF